MQEQSLFIEALEIDRPAERAAFLDRACAGDAVLRQRIERLLQRHQQDDSFLEGAAQPLGATSGHASSAEEAATVLALVEQPGTVIGPYKLLQQIGEGGMGVVFLAEQSQPVQRRVALKIIKPGMDSGQVIARFEAERQALALMDHPNIARVLDAGTVGDPGEPSPVRGRVMAGDNTRPLTGLGSPTPYFVMELIKGLPITKFCDERHLTPRERLELFVPICQAVQHAHQKGIIHRDLKPSNVMVCLYDSKPVPKVIDFGVAKAAGARLTERTLFTELGQVVGTLEYMSPEQAELNQLDIDTRSDIYSLGVLLYELLTGTTPLERQRFQAVAFLEVLRRIREEETPRPSTRLSTTEALPSIAANRGLEPKKLTGLLRGELDWILMKALEKDRNRRYETASAFAADVERYLRDEPVLACPPAAWYRFRKFAQRHKVALRTAAAAVLVLLLVAGGSGWALLDQATRRAETGRTVHEALVTTKRLRDQAGNMPRRTSEEADAILVVWQQAEAALAPALAALKTGTTNDFLRQQVLETQQESERQHAQAQRKAKLLRDLDEARLSRSILIENDFDHTGAAAQYATALAAYDLEVKPGRTEELARRIRVEESGIRDALILALDDWSDNVLGAKSEPLAKQLRVLVSAVDDDAWRQKYRAAASARDAVALRALSREARQLSLPASSLVLLAWRLYARGERGEMLILLRWARIRYPGDFWVHYALGTLLSASGGHSELQLEEAIGCFTTALGLRPKASAAYHNLGTALLEKNQADAREVAIYAFQQALLIDPKLAGTHANLGLALAARDQLDDAIACYRRAIELNPKFAEPHNNLGFALANMKQWNEAIAEYRQAIQLSPSLAKPHLNLGLALMAKKQWHEAIAAFGKAIEINPKFAEAFYQHGLARTAKNQWDEAIAAFGKAIELDPKYAEPHNDLGLVLAAKKQWDEAIDEYKKAIELSPNFPKAYNNLGVARAAKKQWDEAIAAFRKAIDLHPSFAEAYCNGAHTLRSQGQLSASLDFYKRGHALGSKRKDWSQPSLQWVADAEQLVRLEAKLPDVLAGKARPADNRERNGLVWVCRLTRRHVAVTRFYADAFTADPKMADDLKACHRYNAACFAALAAAGQGIDAGKLDGPARHQLRQQTLAWLRADLNLWCQRLEGSQPAQRQAMLDMLQSWQRDTDLASVRDADALTKLPAQEQEASRKLWADVAQVLKKAGDMK